MSFIEQFGHQARLEMHQDNENNERFIFFINDLFLADYLTMLRSEWFVVFDRMAALHFMVHLILADYLTMLRSEWFVVFDRMAALHFEVLPKRLNKENLVNPLYTKTKKHTLSWPEPDTMKKR
jgi:hypothetical protein